MITFLGVNFINNIMMWMIIIVAVIAIFIFCHIRRYGNLKKKYDLNVLLIRKMLDLTSDCMMLIDEKGSILQVNKKIEECHEKSAEKIVGKNIQRFHTDFDYDKQRNEMENYFCSGNVYKVMVNYYKLDKTIVPFDVEIHQLIVDKGQCYYGVIAKNIKKYQENETFIKKQQEKLAEIEHLAKLGYWEVNHRTNEIMWSKELYNIFGYKANTIEPNLDMLFSMVHPGDQERVTKAFTSALQNQESVDIHHRVVNINNETIEVIVRIRHNFSSTDEHLSTIGIVQNITEEKELRNNLDFQTRFSKTVLDNSDILVLTMDENDIILEVNPFIEKLSGFSKEVLIGQPAITIFGQLNRRYLNKLNQMPYYNGPLEMKDKKGRIHFILWNTRELSYLDGRVRVSVGLDVSEGHEYRRKFEYLAYHEPITGLSSRLKLRQVLERYFQKNSGKPNKYMALLFISLTSYNEVNDLYGYAMGDKLVKEASERLNRSIGHYGLLARHSDDLLVLFLPNRKTCEEIEPICLEIIRTLNIPCEIGGLGIVMGGQVGIARYPKDAENKEDLLRFADASMNFARKNSKMDYYFFDEKLRDKIQNNITLYQQRVH
ncbi:MAG: diguanylate cyclase [Eubacterium sp.]